MAETHSRLGATYLLAVPFAGVVVLAVATLELLSAPPPLAWVLLTALTALTGAYTIKIPGLVVRLSVSEPTVFLSTFLFGPAAGAITAAVDALVMSLRLVPHLRTTHRVLFNVGTVAIAVYAAAQLYFSLAGLDTRRPVYGPLEAIVWPLYVFAGGVFAINSWLVAIALSFERGASVFSIWRKQFLWLAATYLASASIAAILVAFTNTFNWALVGLLLPLVAVSFVAVRTTLGRLDDANAHLAEVNHLYLSTIETLAMAVDAKDQVTHGHIRRVQKFAVALAQSLGVTDDRQLKAVEAAALLHDMGKLAIPEFILNKPGRLTTSEFEVMKTHAALGADILSSIHFPYPVVPIVRHHHENWDGSGYPDGLTGSDIPIGARILSVVDCYDALTSDRPYRPAMSDAKAIEILAERRGRMYDPLVVDQFVASLQSLKTLVEPDLFSVIPATHPIIASHAATPTEREQGSVHVSLALLASIAPYPTGRSALAVARDVLSHLRRLAPFEASAIFVCDPRSLELYPLLVDGNASDRLSALRIPFAERLTGWAAAYKTPVWNSDAALDIGRDCPSDLVIASAVPLVRTDTVVGVLTLYGTLAQDVSLAQRIALEDAATPIAESIWEALNRGSQGVDGRRPDVRAAALSALESAISRAHGAQAPGVVAIARLGAIARDSRRADQTSLDAGLQALMNAVLAHAPSRQCVVLSDNCCVFFDSSAQDLQMLNLQVGEVMSTHPLQAYAVELTGVTTSLDLQVLVRRLADQSSRHGLDQREQRVH